MNSSVSETIRIARIFCILLLVYAHAQPHLSSVPDTLFSPAGAIDFLRLLLGHGSVPLLSLISGYLLAKTLSDRPYAVELKNKFFSLIVPLVLWNLIYIFKEYLKSGPTAIPSMHNWPNAVLAITSYPAMLPLYFLRDAFVCFLISPALIYLARKMPKTAGMALLLNAVLNADGPLFINSAIPLFYVVGCALQVHKVPIPTEAVPRWAVVASSAVLVLLSAAPICAPIAWGISEHGSVPYAIADTALRAAGCVVFWATACGLFNSRARTILLGYEPIAFFVFCTHAMTAGIWWMVIVWIGAASESAVYFPYFVVSPLLVLVTSVPVTWAAVAVAPTAFKYLLGGRAPTQKQIQRMSSWQSSKPCAPSL